MSEQKSNIFTAEELKIPIKCKKDTHLLKFHINLLTILGVCPAVVNSQRQRYIKMISAFITGSLLFLSAYVTIAILVCDIPEFTIFERLLSSLSIFTFIPFYGYKTLTNLSRQKSCGEIIASLRQFDDKCKARGDKKSKEPRMKKITFFVYRILAIIFSSVDIIISTLDANTICEHHLNTYLYHTELFYSFSVFTFLWELSDNLRQRYNYIKEQMKKILELHSDGHLPQNQLLDEIRDIKFLYKRLYSVIHKFNENSGMAVLSALIFIQTAILITMFWISFVVSFTSEMFIYNTFLMIYCTVSFFYSYFHLW